MSQTTRQEAEAIDPRSHTISDDKRMELLRIFPEAAGEGGSVDIEKLRLAIGEKVAVGKERYGLNWPGKADCFATIQAPSLATIRPMPKESINWDSTENLIIEGDNLEVLKLLQKSYLGKVKMIYIDPPYNTGNDFIYPDNYSESLDTYLQYTGQVDDEGKKFSTNLETDGRFHSKWLNMMYPRLYLARNLLKEQGYMAVSIDDAELASLRFIMDEVFGAENLLAVLVYDRNRKNDAKFFSVGHEYMVVYAKNKLLLRELDTKLRAPKEGIEEIREEFERLRKLHGDNWGKVEAGLKTYFASFSEDDPRKPLARFTKVDQKGPFRTDGDPSWPGAGGPRYEVLHPKTGKPCKIPSRGWVWSTRERMLEEVAKGNVVFGPDETTIPSIRRNLFEREDQVMRSVTFSYAQKASQDFVKIFDGRKVFDNPKSFQDLKVLVEYLTEPGDLVLDFFAGSGTTAHGVVLANAAGGPPRQFILVQLPELLDPNDDAGAAALELGFKTIADVCVERVRRVLKARRAEAKGTLQGGGQEDLGFRLLKLDSSNFRPWDSKPTADSEGLQRQLAGHVGHVLPGRSEQDLLLELLLKSGFRATAPVKIVKMGGKSIHSIADGAMFICLDKTITLECIRAMADAKPQRVLCLDEGFAGNDQLKANAVQTFKTKGVVFKTV